MEKKIVNNYGSFDVIFASGKGATLTDVDGKQYIDFVSGIGVNCLGHAHPKLVKAVQEQAARQIHISNYYLSDVGLEFARKLLELTQFEGGFFGNSGAEANEAAIKLARKYGYLNGGAGRKTIVTLQKSFHGRTIETLTATGQDKFHPECFAPYPATFKYIPANDYEAIQTAFDSSVCALMLECVQGEGGVNNLSPEFVKGIEKLCKEEDIVMIVDEVQTGNGRSGCFYSYQCFDVMPDVVTTAKGLAGGLPIGAVMLGERLKDVFGPGDHGSTFGGNPVACAGAISIVNRIDDALLSDVKKKSEYIFSEMKGAEGVMEVTGLGLMIGIRPVKPAAEVIKYCMDNGVLCLSAKDKIRLLPALNIPMELLEKGIAVIKAGCKA